jgi:GNAT superfamily N-acetyltransferase
MTLAGKLDGLSEEWRRRGNSRRDKLLRVTQRSVRALGLEPAFEIGRCRIVELTKTPKLMRGFSDLTARLATHRDIPGLSSVVGADPVLLRARFDRGDLCHVGEVEGQILCHTWFHPGPKPFEEERAMFARWAVDATTFWSYDAMTRPEARSAGIFVKVFSVALRAAFEVHGARRIQGFIHHTNEASLMMHERLGFAVLGTVTSVALPGVKWVEWHGGGVAKRWVLRRNGDFAMSFPLDR